LNVSAERIVTDPRSPYQRNEQPGFPAGGHDRLGCCAARGLPSTHCFRVLGEKHVRVPGEMQNHNVLAHLNLHQYHSFTMEGRYRNLTNSSRAGGPLVGALLRRPFFTVRSRVVLALHREGFTDVQASHLAAFQYPGPDGRSPLELARSAQVSKQAMNHLLTQLEGAGYLERVIDPDNQRQRLVVLTERGHGVVAVIRAAVAEVEAEWEAVLGATTYRQLRGALFELANHLELAERDR
jgi:DNA-binding MarR family transcriptional regulator